MRVRRIRPRNWHAETDNADATLACGHGLMFKGACRSSFTVPGCQATDAVSQLCRPGAVDLSFANELCGR